MTQRIPGLQLVDHELEVPLDHDAPGGDTLTVYAREVTGPDGGGDKPYLLSCRADPAARARGRACRPRPAGSGGPSRTTACCCSTSAAPVAPHPSATCPG
ncbi:hypothetical protein GCM10027070_17250 [Barrientosiimonas humi]